MSTKNSELVNILTTAQPLGPIAQEWIKDSVARELLDDQILLFRDASNEPHTLFLGRKGAGKSALLTEIRLNVMRNGRRGSERDELPSCRSDFVLPVMSWREFHQIVISVGRESPEEDFLAELIPPEHFTDLWKESLWHQIIIYFSEFAHYDEVRELLAPVDKYVNVGVPTCGTPRQAAVEIFQDAKAAVIRFLEVREARLFFLFDSMDEYPVRNNIFARVAVGLFQALISVSNETSRIIISFCIPEEIEKFLIAGSANVMKDFSSSFRIRWTPTDLIKIIAHRLRVSAEINDINLYNKIKDLNLSNRSDLHKVFRLILPDKIHNFQGHEENPLAYMLRHTQMLPRHLLKIFNTALSEQLRTTGGFNCLSQDLIRRAVGESQSFIAGEILRPYNRLYPKLLNASRKILPDVDPICDYQSLRKIESRFDRMIEEDIGSVWETFFEIGMLGRSTGKAGNEHHGCGEGSRYCYGQFHFNAEIAFGFATDGEYCFHPVFSRAFGMTRRKVDSRVVYPANANLENIYDE